jgi:hypothetical protein
MTMALMPMACVQLGIDLGVFVIADCRAQPDVASRAACTRQRMAERQARR